MLVQKPPSISLLLLILLSLNICPWKVTAQEVEDLNLSTEQLEERLIDWVNRGRIEKGMTALVFHPVLRAVARSHCRKMLQENRLSHSFPDYKPLEERIRDAGLFALSVGENIAESETFITRLIHQALMDSPCHRKNILNETYAHMGIGVVYTGHVYYICQVFATIAEPPGSEPDPHKLNRRKSRKGCETQLKIRL